MTSEKLFKPVMYCKKWNEFMKYLANVRDPGGTKFSQFIFLQSLKAQIIHRTIDKQKQNCTLLELSLISSSV